MRQFLALPLTEELRRAASRSAHLLVDNVNGWRVTRDEGLHLTIRFLGDVSFEHRAEQESLWGLASAGTGLLPLRVCGARLLPGARRPRVLALDVLDDTPDGALARLAQRVEEAARGAGFAPERRPFRGHVTIARARGHARPGAPNVAEVAELGAFVADRLVLYRSDLSAGGSRYSELRSFPLATGPRP